MEKVKTVCTLSELKKLDVVNLCDGKVLGMVCDVEMDLLQGNITALIVPKAFDIIHLFQPESERIPPRAGSGRRD